MLALYDGGGAGDPAPLLLPPFPPPFDVCAAGTGGAVAVCSTGFCTCILFTDCIMGGCVFVCRALHACSGIGRAIGADEDGVLPEDEDVVVVVDWEAALACC